MSNHSPPRATTFDGPQHQPQSEGNTGGTQRADDNENDNDTTPDEATDADADTTDTATGDLPMSMNASVILTNLPKDASHALALVDELDDFKGTVYKKCLFSLSCSSPSPVLYSPAPNRGIY